MKIIILKKRDFRMVPVGRNCPFNGKSYHIVFVIWDNQYYTQNKSKKRDRTRTVIF